MNTAINGIDFGPIWGMSGIQNFFGEGYWYHDYLKAVFGMSFDRMTFVAKTTTLDPRPGNMPLDRHLQPKEFIPRCIYVDPIRSIALNAVGLSGPGFDNLLGRGTWQKRVKPFFISFMPVAETAEGKIIETRKFVQKLLQNLDPFYLQLGVQVNISCPNVGSDAKEIVELAGRILDEFGWLTAKHAVIIVKVSVDMPVEKVVEISKHRNCHGICVSNSLPFGALPEEVDWKKLFPKGSPLIARGFKQPGGLSGAPLHPIVVKWIRKARTLGLKKHINAGGGILKPEDLHPLHQVGADSFSIGSIVMLRPWNVNSVIREAYLLGQLD